MIILPSWLITSAEEKPLPNWGLRILNDQVFEVSPNQVLKEKYQNDEVWDASGQIAAPGFVDAHTHLYGILAHGIPLDKSPSGFMPFLEDFWWPLVENRLNVEMISAATDYNCAALIHSGITSFYDCEEAPNALPGLLQKQAECVANWGLRGILSFEATQRLSAENGQLGLQENANFIDLFGKSGSLIRGMMCFHTTFTCDAHFIQDAYRIAEEKNTLVHSHCSEGTYEPEYAIKEFGMRPIQYYEKLGVLGKHSFLSQCVQLDDAEIELLAMRDVRVSHMPLSNCEVGGGIAPIPEMVKAGLTIGLGSDGYITDFFEVMRGAFLIHKANQLDPQTMPAQLVWQMATEGGARVLGLEKVGCLRPGWQADVQLIKWNFPNPICEHNLFDLSLLYCHQSDVTGVLVAGATRMRDRIVRGEKSTLLKQRLFKACEDLWSKC